MRDRKTDYRVSAATRAGDGKCLRLAILSLATVLATFSAVTPGAVMAQSPHFEDEGDGMLGCGKAEALAHRFLLSDPNGSVVFAEALDDTDVIHYQLDIEITNIDPANNQCTITGSNRIRVRSQVDGLTEFTFRLREQFIISDAIVNDETAAVSVVVDTVSETTRVATLDRPYAAGEEFTIKIDYAGDTLSLGFGSINVATQPLGSQIVSTLSEPFYAYTWWPAKNGDVGLPGDNTDKATIEFSVTVPDTLDVPSNGLLQSIDTLPDNRLRYNWSTVNPIATYLVSFAAGEYNRWTETYVHPGGSMPVEFYIYPGNDTPQNRQSWSRVVDMLGVFGDVYGEYPFVNEKYGIYNFPFGGGMEHQTMVGQGTFSEMITAHEAAHQWWGDLVTCKTWSDIWLNEGFASYGECLWREFESGVSDHTAYLSRVLQRKPQNFDGSVYVPPEIMSVGRIFSSTYTYNKGCWVLHQLRHVVGDDTFFQILANYRNTYANSAATTDDFAAVASATYGEDLFWFFDQWVYQIGAPDYRFAWDTIYVSGQDFLLAHVQQVQVPEYPDVFTAPIDLLVWIDPGPRETVTVWNDRREQWFAIPVSGTVTSLLFDPNQWVLRSGATQVVYGSTPGDFDGDGDVDTTDATTMRQCMADSQGDVPVGCDAGDFNDDGSIDCDDWDQFGLVWMEEGEPPPAIQCLGIAPAASAWGLVVLALVMLVAGTVTIRGRQTLPAAIMSTQRA